MSDIEIDFDQVVHANEHARPSPVGDPPCSRATIQEDFHTPIAINASANRIFSQGHLTPIILQDYIILRLYNKLNSSMFKF